MLVPVRRWTRSGAVPLLWVPLVAAAALAQGPSYEPLPTAPSPSSRFVWDAGRGVVVAVDPWPEPRTWVWDGSGWDPVAGDTTPQSNGEPLFHDPVRDRVLMVNSQTIHTWDGAIWTATTAPGALATMAFDAGRGRLVTTDGAMVREWDGAAWSTMPSGGGPGVRQRAAFSYDPIGRRCLLYGGVGQSGLADCWAWDGAGWTQLAVHAPPGSRIDPVLAHDPAASRMVLFGGGSNSTWALANGVWFQVTTPRDPGVRVGGTLAWDGAGLLFHGGSSARGGELWRLVGGHWTELDGGVPVVREFAAVGWDRVRGHALLFGGQERSGLPPPMFDDTWIHDGRWRRVVPTNRPSPVAGPQQLVWSTAENMLLLWRGASTWNWTGSDWVDRAPATSPPYRIQQAMATDPVGGVMLFGGRLVSPHTYLGDHWYWNGSDWRQLAPTTLPSPRAFAVAVHDPWRNQVVLAGGVDGSSFYQETWMWDGAAWAQGPMAPFANASGRASAAFRPNDGAVIVADHSFHEWDGVQWTTSPAPVGQRQGAQLVTDLSLGAIRAYPAAGREGDLATLASRHAAVVRYGAPCAIGPAPVLVGIGQPALGNGAHRIGCVTRAPSAPVLLALALNATSQPLGRGCSLLVANPLAVRFLLASSAGTVEVGIPIPNDSRLYGVDLYAQAVVADAARSLIHGVTISGGLHILIGY